MTILTIPKGLLRAVLTQRATGHRAATPTHPNLITHAEKEKSKKDEKSSGDEQQNWPWQEHAKAKAVNVQMWINRLRCGEKRMIVEDENVKRQEGEGEARARARGKARGRGRGTGNGKSKSKNQGPMMRQN